MFARLALLFVFCALFSACFEVFVHSEQAEDLPRCQSTVKIDLANGSHYLLNVPSTYSKDESWGLLLFLHGKKVNNEALMNAFLYGCDDQKSFLGINKYIGIAPHCKEECWGTQEPTPMLALLNVLTQYKIDKSRIHILGINEGGGFASWLGYSRADIFQSVTLISSPLARTDKNDLKKHENRPVYFIVGEDDSGIKKVQKDFNMIVKKGNEFARLKVLKEQGNNVQFWNDFSNLAQYLKATESGFDYPGNLVLAEKHLKRKEVAKAIEVVATIEKQPYENVFFKELERIKTDVNNAGEIELKRIIRNYQDDEPTLKVELEKFEKMYSEYPVSELAKKETKKLKQSGQQEKKD